MKQIFPMNYLYLNTKGLLVVILLIMTICFSSCSKDGLTGRRYVGYYQPVEKISLEFETDSRVVGEISSTDFVGHFSDCIYGSYEYKHPYIKITWTEVDSDNDKYKSVISSPDSIIINESLDTLRLYEKTEDYVLTKHSLYQIDSNAPILEQIGQYCGQTILLLIIFVIKNFFLIVLAVIIMVLVKKWRKKGRKKSNLANDKDNEIPVGSD